jgi:redox-sensitive bicupin YhaK (pirin superfamily)
MPIELIISPREKDLGGFAVRRALPVAKRRHVGPFVFFDHLGPATFPSGAGIDVRPHPHIGLATVTWLFDGALDHRDSIGTVQTIYPGAVNWMTAGRGISHSERTPPEQRANGHRIEAIQTWVALPQSHEEIAPSFHHYPASVLPKIDMPGARATLIAGEAFGARSPVTFPTPIVQVALEAERDVTFETPEAAEIAVYAVRGSLVVDGERLEEAQMAILVPGTRAKVELPAGSKMMIVGGDPPDGPRFIDWNFVSSSKVRIDKAQVDWRNSIAGGFNGTWFTQPPGEASYIPLPGDPEPDPMDTPPL